MKKYALHQIAKLTNSELIGDPNHLISGVEDLELASEEHASFLENPKYEQKMKTSLAGVVFVNKEINRLEGRNYLLTDHPSLAFQKAIELFLPETRSGFSSIHPSAVIHPDAIIGKEVTIGPLAVIDRGVKIGSGTKIHPHVVIFPDVTIGEHCEIFSHVTIREGSVIGNRAVIQPGAVIGSSGFGYFTDKRGKHHYLKQMGNVTIEDDVEIGANTTIDRARFKTTRIGKGSKVDNLVQIAHQVQIGEDNLIVSQTGIAGSSKTGKNVVLGGQVGVVGHIEIADRVILAARSAPIKSITEAGVYGGAPAMPIREFNEQMVHIRNLPKYIEMVKAMTKSMQG